MYSRKIDHIYKKIGEYEDKKLKIFATSSFQTNSVVLLHILGRLKNRIPVYFLNTGYHFPETLQFKDELAEKFALNVVDLFPQIPKSQQRDSSGQLMFASDPDYCCYMNKIQPLEPVKRVHDVWINGIRSVQNKNRGNKEKEERNGSLIRFHPILDWSDEMVSRYLQHYDLPRHPLEGKGYASIGCQPCTRKIFNAKNDRKGRWEGLNKTECGLHLKESS